MGAATSPSNDVIRGFGRQSWISNYQRSVAWMEVAACQDKKDLSTVVSMNTDKKKKKTTGKQLRKTHNKAPSFTYHKLLL